MCRRRNQTSYYPSASQIQPQYGYGYGYHRGGKGCCTKRTRRQARRDLEIQALAAQFANTHLSPSNNPSASANHQPHQPSQLQPSNQQIIFVPTRSRHNHCSSHSRPHPRGPISGMAALLLTGIAVGAQKIQERRDKKREAKRALEMEEEQARKEGNVVVIDERVRSTSRERVDSRRDEGRRRKSEEAREQRGSRSRGSSVERESVGQQVQGGEAPPSYEVAVGEASVRRN